MDDRQNLSLNTWEQARRKGAKPDVAALEQQNRTLLWLNQAGQALTSTVETGEVLERLLQAAVEIIGAEGSSVWLWDQEEPDCLVCRAAFHENHVPPLVNQRLRSGTGIAGWVAQTGKSTIVAEAAEDERFYPEVDAQSNFTTRSLLAVPLQLREQRLGVLEVVNKRRGNFSNEDLAVAETLAASASIAIDNARLVEELKQQKSDLQARNEELDAFAHTVAHDLQNPLALIIGFAELLLRDDARLGQKERKEALQTITNNVQKMSNIVQELLLLARLRKTQIEADPLQMEAIVASALESLSYLLEEYEADVLTPDEWPVVLGHAPWVEQVWENYISNALKYGGKPPRVALGATPQANGMIRFWVRDNGPGIPEEAQTNLFTPFTQLSEIRVSGQGLGLSIVQRIVEKLGGTVGVESEVGQGSTFSFTLPRAPAE